MHSSAIKRLSNARREEYNEQWVSEGGIQKFFGTLVLLESIISVAE